MRRFCPPRRVRPSLHDAITKRQRHDSHNGRALTQGVVEALSGRAPFFLPYEGLSALCYRLLGPELGRHLGLQNSVPWHVLFQAGVPALRGSAARRVEPTGGAPWSGLR